jgi:hypothetical protein
MLEATESEPTMKVYLNQVGQERFLALMAEHGVPAFRQMGPGKVPAQITEFAIRITGMGSSAACDTFIEIPSE